MDYEDFTDKILHNYQDYLKLYTPPGLDKDIKVSIRYTTDDRFENPLEKLIRETKAGINISNKYDNYEKVESIIDDQSDISEDDQFYFQGYLEYLLTAWKEHLGIEVAPWFFWNVILWVIKEINKGEPEKYRNIWSTSNDKVDILLENDKFDINQYINKLKEYVPEETIDNLVVTFNNQPNNYLESVYGLISEISIDYYKCMVLACNIPEVRVLGDKLEWEKLLTSIDNLKNHYQKNDCLTVDIDRYLTKTSAFIKECIDNLGDKEFWSKFFFIDKCGSGSQQKVSGHIEKMLIKHEVLVENLPKLVSRFNFKLQDDKKINKGSYITGLISGNNENGILVGKYAYITTQYTFDQIDEKEIKSNLDMVKCLEILNSYSRSNVHHTLPLSCSLEKIIKDKDVLLGNISIEEHIENLQKKHNNLDVDKTIEILKKKRKEYEGKDFFYLIEDVIQHQEKTFKNLGNFWELGEFKRNSISKVFVDNIKWIKGRKIQYEKGHIKLLCDNMENILTYLFKKYNNFYSLQKKYIDVKNEYILSLFYSCYNEDVYKKLFEVAPNYFYFENNKDTYVTESHIKSGLILFLLESIVPDLINSKDELNINCNNATYHSEFVTQYLFNSLFDFTNFEKNLEVYKIIHSYILNQIDNKFTSFQFNTSNFDNIITLYKNCNHFKNYKFNNERRIINFLLTKFYWYSDPGNKDSLVNTYEKFINVIIKHHYPNLKLNEYCSGDEILYVNDNENDNDEEFVDEGTKITIADTDDFFICGQEPKNKMPVCIKDFIHLSSWCNDDYNNHNILNKDNYRKEELTYFNQCLWFTNEIITNNDISSKTVVDINRYNKKREEHSDIIKQSIDNIDVIFKFLKKNDKNYELIKRIVYSFDFNLIKTFIIKFLDDPYLINMTDSNVNDNLATLIFFGDETKQHLENLKNVISEVSTGNKNFSKDPLRLNYDKNNNYLLFYYLIKLEKICNDNSDFIEKEIIDKLFRDLVLCFSDRLKILIDNTIEILPIYLSYHIDRVTIKNFLLTNKNSYYFDHQKDELLNFSGDFKFVFSLLNKIDSILKLNKLTSKLLSQFVSSFLKESINYDF